MKHFTENQLVKLGECLPDIARQTSAKLSLVIGGNFHSATLYQSWQEGFINCNTIEVTGETIAVIFWHKTFTGSLHVNAAVNITNETFLPQIVAAVEQLAQNNACKEISFVSSRPGLAKQIKTFGFVPESIVFTKRLTNG